MKQMNALLQQAVPGIAFAVFQSRVLISSPFLVERHSTVLLVEISPKRLLKAAAKNHGGTGVLLLPAVQIAIAVQTRAAEILANLCVAVDHRSLLSVLWQADCDRPKLLPILPKRRSCPGSNRSAGQRFCARCG